MAEEEALPVGTQAVNVPVRTVVVTEGSGGAYEINPPPASLSVEAYPPGVVVTTDVAADTAHFEGQVTTTVRTVIIRTVLANQVVVQLTALSLLYEIDKRIEDSRSNSETAELDDLKRRVEELLDATANRKENSIADAALAITDGLRSLFRHDNVRNTGLLGVGLSFCAAAGALGVSDPVILAVSAIAGGKNVADVINATANLVWGKGKSDKS